MKKLFLVFMVVALVIALSFKNAEPKTSDVSGTAPNIELGSSEMIALGLIPHWNRWVDCTSCSYVMPYKCGCANGFCCVYCPQCFKKLDASDWQYEKCEVD